MPKPPFADVLTYIRTLCGQRQPDLTDSQLLDRFIADREETAFALLVQRHGPLVMGVCQRVLRDSHAAEDVFQATFLVLAKRAAAIRKRTCIGTWLHGVAQRVALKARGQRLAQRDLERQASKMPRTEPIDEVTWQDLRVALDEEIAALPEKFAAPLVLCYLQDKTYDQAARQLGWTKSMLARRIGEARELLRKRLVRRGITLSAGAVATVLTTKANAAPIGALLTIGTVRAAMSFCAAKAPGAGSVSATVVGLAEAAMEATIETKSKVALLVLALALAVSGASWASYGTRRETAITALAEQPQEGLALAKPVQPAKLIPPVAADRLGDPLPEGAIARLGTTRLRHGEIIRDLGFSPEGKTLISADHHGVHVWDAETGKQLRTFGEIPGGQVQSPYFSSDCRLVALAPWNGGRIEIWDAATGRLLRQFACGRFPKVRFSPDGQTLAVLDGGGIGEPTSLELWDATTGEKRRELRGHAEQIYDFVFSSDGKTAVTASHDKSVRFWNVASGQQEHQINQQGPLGHIAVSPDGKTLASVGTAKSSREVQKGQVIVSLVASDFVTLWDVVTGKESHRLKAPGQKDSGNLATLLKGIMGIAFSPDGKTLVSSDQRSIYWWDVATGNELPGHKSPVLGGALLLGFAADGKTLATGGSSIISLGDVSTGKEKLNFGNHRGGVGAVAVSPDGRTFATGSSGHIHLWSAATGEVRHQLGGHEMSVRSMVFAADGKTLLSNGRDAAKDDGSVIAWDTTTGIELRRFPGSWSALAPDGKTLLTGGKEKLIHVWDVSTGQEIREWEAPGRGPSELTYSGDGGTVFAWCSEDKMVRIWDVATSKLLRSFPGYGFGKEESQRALRHAFSSDGTLGAFSGNPHHIELYDLKIGKLVKRLIDTNLSGSVSSLAFSPDCRMLVSGDWTDGKVHLWELATGQHCYQFAGHKGIVTHMAFSMDGSVLLTGSLDTTALVWDMTGRLTAGKAAPLSAKELEAHWADLASDDAVRAQKAVRSLVKSAEPALAFFTNQLKPAPTPDVKRISQLIAELDSNQLKTREKAMHELEAMGDITAPTLQKAIDANPSLELKQRLKKLLDEFSSTQRLRTVRAVQVLEQIGTQRSRELLDQLARGELAARLTREASAAAKRLSLLGASMP
jgi:RNA polymerase sigma factor (sigma-70 family)